MADIVYYYYLLFTLHNVIISVVLKLKAASQTVTIIPGGDEQTSVQSFTS